VPRKELTSLFSAIGAGDLDRARREAERFAESEEHGGRVGVARSLRAALAQPPSFERRLDADSAGLLALPPDTLQRLPADVRLSDVAMPADARGQLAGLLTEHRHRDRLIAHGLSPQGRLLLHGPPGCGKTMTARALGAELDLPVYVVRFDALVGSFLGQTSSRLSEVFRFAQATPSVVVLDEIDAIGRRRGQSTDIGELDRVVITLMQQLDLVRPAGVLVAASNLLESLDAALVRRFDLVTELPSPDSEALAAYVKAEAARRGVRLANGFKAAVSAKTTFADARRSIEIEQKRVLLSGD
jgi:SpoVK/Ycf46/Vps4 family AAA+-type ATPase